MVVQTRDVQNMESACLDQTFRRILVISLLPDMSTLYLAKYTTFLQVYLLPSSDEKVTEHSVWMAGLFWTPNVHVSSDYHLRMEKKYVTETS